MCLQLSQNYVAHMPGEKKNKTPV